MAEFNIKDVLMIHGIKAKGQQEMIFPCPECGASNGACSAVVSKIRRNGKEVKNVYDCKRCGSSGSMFKLHKLFTFAECKENGQALPDFSGPDELKKIAKDIHRKLGDKDFQQYVPTQRDETDDDAMVRVMDYTEIRKGDYAYRCLLGQLSLNDAHIKDLERRGLSERFAKKLGIRSVPQNSFRVCEMLEQSNVELDQVAGFYKYGNHHNFYAESGYFCPVYDGDRNLLLGFQIRRDNADKERKYVWFTSAKQEGGVSSGAPATYLPGKKKITIITEGILKATVIWRLLDGEFGVIGIPGVSILKSLDMYLDRFTQDNFCFLAFDMDKQLAPANLHFEADVQKFIDDGSYPSIDDFVIEERKKEADMKRKGVDDYVSPYKPFIKAYGIRKAEDALEEYVSNFGLFSHRLTWDVKRNGEWNGEWKGLDDYLHGNPKYIKPLKDFLVEKSEKLSNIQRFLARKE